ncbi:Ubiquitin carboxyl-terminal hydrolase 12 [Melia azedarach]|uniref:Ubiquitin carboxyl-terminal hydrolase 12 n=1 Tax=Melia azedarach TaxID=155640 RepID=A0ACC1YDQ1_MELAZ|nr:Ubiquitin carboxyl-terminal hydrolase 12 [Melia azedarach]
MVSLLMENNAEAKYESGEFEAGKYKWKLVLYPKGNKSKKVTKDHISLYLAISNTSSLGFGWEVYAVFRLFLLDQNNDQFLILQDALGKERRFHGLKLEWGFDQFIPHKVFKDEANGYLVEDTFSSMFGRLKTFQSWDQNVKNQKYSLLEITNDSSVKSIHAEFKLSILDPIRAKHITVIDKAWFTASGWGRSKFAELGYLNQTCNGFVVKDVDVDVVQGEVIVLGILKSM